jgi:hypothetical protein
MGLFSKKKPSAPTAAPKKPATVNADDIWNTPVRSKQQEVVIKESKYDEAKPEKLEVESIEPEVIRTKMAQLEKELAEKNSKPVKTHADYGTSTVDRDEIVDAQAEYEKLYEVEHERYVKSHYEDITEAKQSGMEEKMQAMYAEHEQKQQEFETTDFKFNEVNQSEVEAKLADLPYAKKPEDYPEYKDIKAVSKEPDESEIEKLGRIDHSEDPDNIGEVSDELLAEKVREFEAKYGAAESTGN